MSWLGVGGAAIISRIIREVIRVAAGESPSSCTCEAAYKLPMNVWVPAAPQSQSHVCFYL